MEQLILSIQKYIDIYYLIVFMCITYTLKNTFHAFLQWVLRTEVNKHFAVFVIGSLAAIPFLFYFKHDPLILLLTYSVGTSIHDLIIQFLIKMVNNFFNNKPNKNE